MSRRKPHINTADTTRRRIASAAARLMAESGVGDYGAAKRKAAQALGIDSSDGLPTNQEIEVELRAYQSLYQEEEHPQRLRELREAAIGAMHDLAEFQPRLRGAVLEGTAGRYAEIDLMLFADSSKDVEMWLLSRNIPYEIGTLRNVGTEGPEARLTVDRAGHTMHLDVFLPQQARSNPVQARSGRYRHGAPLPAVEALLTDPPATSAGTSP